MDTKASGSPGENSRNPTKTALKLAFQGHKLVAGAGFVPHHAAIVAHFPSFSRLFVQYRLLPGGTPPLQIGVRFGVRWWPRLFSKAVNPKPRVPSPDRDACSGPRPNDPIASLGTPACHVGRDSRPWSEGVRTSSDTRPILSDTRPTSSENCPTKPRNPVRQKSESLSDIARNTHSATGSPILSVSGHPQNDNPAAQTALD